MRTETLQGLEAERRQTRSHSAGDRASSTAINKLGIAALLCAGVAIAGVARIGTSAGYSWLTPALLVAGFGGAGAVMATLRMETGSLAWSQLRRLAEVWTSPVRPSIMFLFGALLALPVLALHTSYVSGDADSARLVASVVYVRRFGVRYLIETQEVLLPHLVFGPLMAVGGVALVKLFLALSVVGLAGVVSYITWQVTRSVPAALASVLALLSFGAIAQRAYYLPMYAPMLAFGFLGCYLTYRGADKTHRRDQIRYAVLAATSLVFSIESHQVGQLFLVAAPVLLFFHRSGRRVRTFITTYGAFALLYLPRALINLAEGGFSHFSTNRDDYWITQGYLVEIQKRFWYLGNESPLTEYLSDSVEGAFDILGWHGVPAAVLAVVALFLVRRRALWFGLTFAVFFAVLAVERRLPLYPRYFSHLLVGGAIAAGLAIAAFFERGGRYRTIGVSSVILLGAAALVTLTLQVNTAERLETGVLQSPYPRLAAAVDDDKGIVGARSTYLNFTRTDLITYGGQFLTEREFVTFLTWPSDEAVLDMMSRNDIGWVLVPERRGRWVYRYNNTWLLPHYGRPAVYPRVVRRSPFFCHALSAGRADLYKLSTSAPREKPERDRPCRTCTIAGLRRSQSLYPPPASRVTRRYRTTRVFS